MKKRIKIESIILIIVAMFVYIPLWMVITGSFMGITELSSYIGPIVNQGDGMASMWILPSYPTLRPFMELLLDTPQFFVMFWNSCIQVIPMLAGQMLIAVPAAWAFSRYTFRGRNLLYFIYIILMVLPFQVTMVSNYIVLMKLKLIDHHLALILPGIFSTFPVFIMTKFFQSIPKALIEAARLDGASEITIFIKVGIPMGASGILSILVLGFIEYWNAIEQPLTFLRNKEYWPLSLYLPKITSERAGVAFAASMLMMLPSLLMFLYGQKYLEQGIVASGLKE